MCSCSIKKNEEGIGRKNCVKSERVRYNIIIKVLSVEFTNQTEMIFLCGLSLSRCPSRHAVHVLCVCNSHSSLGLTDGQTHLKRKNKCIHGRVPSHLLVTDFHHRIADTTQTLETETYLCPYMFSASYQIQCILIDEYPNCHQN